MYKDIIDLVQKEVGGKYVLSERDVLKNNGVTRTGIAVAKSQMPSLIVVLYPDEFIEPGSDLYEAAAQVVDKIEAITWPEFNIPATIPAADIFGKVVDKERNMAMLADMPYRDIPGSDGLVLTYIAALDAPFIRDGVATTTVTNRLMECWNVTEEDLYTLAKQNSGYKVRSLLSQVQLCMGHMDMLTHDPDADIEDLPPDDMAYVCVSTVCNSSFGASVLALGRDILERLRKRTGKDLWILPSSLHEVICLPCSDEHEDPEAMLELVRSVNGNEACIAATDVLTDHVYLFSEDGLYRVV